MYTSHWVNRFLALLAFLLPITSAALSTKGNPGYTGSFSIRWESPRQIGQPLTAGSRMLAFEGSTLHSDFGLLPVMQISVPVESDITGVSMSAIIGAVYETVDAADLLYVDGLERIGTDIVTVASVTLTRKIPALTFHILPLRRNPASGAIERLVSFVLQAETIRSGDQSASTAVSARAANSVLATGNWFKFLVASTGVCRLTYDDLKNAGLDVGSLDPRDLRVYGNGGGMLPEANSARRVDDLMENAVYVYGEEDGRLDPGDYILFYGESPDAWTYNASDHLFRHSKNIYSDRTAYFLTANLGRGKRIQAENGVQTPATAIISRFDDFAFYEKDEANLIKSGREWWDKQYFDVTIQRNYSFSFPNIDSQNPVTLTVYAAARSTSGNTSFTVAAQGNTLMTLPILGVSGGFEDDYANSIIKSATFLTSNPVIDVRMSYNKSSSNSIGYLNYLELNATRLLTMSGNQMSFRSVASVGPGNVSEFTLNGSGPNLEIWDVSHGANIRRVTTTRTGNNFVFRLATDTLREFIAFDGNAFIIPESAGRVENQDLHGTPVADYLIVAHPTFLTDAERLADFHRIHSNLSVFITTPDKIYNEFSSGVQDVSAIRDFVRMMYDKAEPGHLPRYLLLFGDASYDFKNRTQNNTNFVPAYASGESLSPISSYVSDDYFGKLDPGEGQSANGTLDIGVGRFPVFTTEQATRSVDKVLHYCSNYDVVKNDWRNVVTLVSDDQNEGGNLFVNDSEDIAAIIEGSFKDYNIDKIYSDAWPMLSTPGGGRYPEVNETINKRVEKGSLIVNYVGHGGEVGWAHERILEVPDIQNWTNMNNMPVFVTATCEFSRFDDPERVSAGEWVYLNERGGGVALFTTTRLTFAGTNKSLLVNFYNNVFRKTNGEYMRMGDLLVAAKENMGSYSNIHAFVLLGDPALEMAYPDLQVVTTSINSGDAKAVPDTLKALEVVTISGEIQDHSGNLVADFNGTVFPTVYDKASEVWTLANQGPGQPVKFYLRKNPVYKGKVEVVNGQFTFSFIVPKDIAYQFGQGRISYYARSATTDANGYDNDIQVGGYNNQAPVDNQGPELALYLNDRNFRSGGISGPVPLLLADVSDTSGINTVGNGIGHDITAVLDNKSTSPLILNDYYVSDLNTYKSGEIWYPISRLADGPHTITVKVWDVYNNSTEATLNFVVVSSAEFALDHIMNYPNPMVDHTTFCWQTNQVDQPLEVQVRIFTLQGDLIKVLRQNYFGTGFRTVSLAWDGTQDSGRKISSGMYVYEIQLIIADGTAKSKTSKLVVIR